MRIAVIGAAGKAGKLIAAEASERGHEVIGFGRSTKPGVDIVKDALELIRDDLGGFDVVVDALGFFTPETLPLHTSSLEHLASLLAGSPTRLLVVGGAGSLYLDAEHTTQLKDAPDFPEAYKPMAEAQAAQLTALRKHTDTQWTYISPAADFRADGERLGSYVLAGELFETGSDGQSTVSYADYALAVVDEIEAAKHIGQRISVHAR